MHLLEAKRRRLLRQQDWIGIDPSKPVKLHCLSNRKKGKIGKRRKISGKLHSVTQPVNNAADRLLTPLGNGFAEGLAPGVIRDNVNHIRIRIGSDALANTQPSLSDQVLQSQASSEPMLFDQEVQDAKGGRQPKLPEPVELWHHGASTPLQEGRITLLPDERTHLVLTQGRRPDSYQHAPRHTSSVHEQTPPPDLIAVRATEQPGKSSVSGRQAMPYFQGVKDPLCLNFQDPKSSVDALGSFASPNESDELKFADEVTPAEDLQKEHVCQDSSVTGQPEVNKLSAELAVVDEEPWRTFLAVSAGSSGHSILGCETRDSLTHPLPTTRTHKTGGNWSQQATRGGQTHASASSISAPLPSLRQPMSVRYSGAKHARLGNIRTPCLNLDEDERLWQAFVFGSNHNLWSESLHNLEQSGEQGISTGFAETPRYLPLSAAVSFVSSTPLNEISRPSSGKGEHVQDLAGSAPPSVARITCSPDMHIFTDELSDEGQIGRRAEGRTLGEPSVTHTSMQNNASFDTDYISSRICSDTRTSRSSLDRPHHTRFVSSAWASASGRELQCSSSSYDHLEDSNEGLDIVDPNRC